MNSKGQNEPLNPRGYQKDINDNLDETMSPHYCDTGIAYCPSPYWIDSDYGGETVECNIAKWNLWCNCHKDRFDAVNQTHWFDDGIYHCSHSGNDWQPCLSATQCYNQAWYKNCTCVPLDTIGGSGCPSFECYGCHTSGSGQEFVPGFGWQFWYYPEWFIDSCIPPYDWPTQGEDQETEPPGRETSFLIPAFRREGGNLDDSGRRPRRTRKGSRGRNFTRPNVVNNQLPSTRENCPCCTEGPGQAIILCEQGAYLGTQNQCTLGAYPPVYNQETFGCGTAEHQNWTVPCICGCDCSYTGTGGPDSHFPGTGGGSFGGYTPRPQIDNQQSGTSGRQGRKGGDFLMRSRSRKRRNKRNIKGRSNLPGQQGSLMSWGGSCPSLDGHCSNYMSSSDCNTDPCCCWSGSNHNCNGCGNPQGPCGVNGTWDQWYASNTGTWVDSHCQEFACDQKAGCKDPMALNYCPDCVFCCEVGYTQAWADETNCCCYDISCTQVGQEAAPPSREVRKGGVIKGFGRKKGRI